MRKYLLIIVVLGLSIGQGSAQFGKLINKAKEVLDIESDELDIGGGLKEALENGVTEAVETLSTTDGYFDSPYKILIPEEAQKVVNTLKRVPGFTDIEENLVKKMNQAAELAAKEATPIFVNAIKNMTFEDAKNILFGENDAATVYLENQSRNELYRKFLPVIQSALDEVNAREYWNEAVVQYNKIPLTRDLNPELDDHVNNTALNGMFGFIKVKEDKIRSDVNQRTSPLLKDVFGQLDN